MKVWILSAALLVASCAEPTFKPEATAALEDLRPPEMSDSQWESILYQHFLASDENADFNFFGKVVDESNFPVDGAIVEVEVSSNNDDLADSLRRKTLRAPKLEFTVSTSSGGTFEILNQRGFTLNLLSIRKDGLEHDGDIWFSYTLSSDTGAAESLGSPSDPIVFRMSKRKN